MTVFGFMYVVTAFLFTLHCENSLNLPENIFWIKIYSVFFLDLVLTLFPTTTEKNSSNHIQDFRIIWHPPWGSLYQRHLTEHLVPTNARTDREERKYSFFYFVLFRWIAVVFAFILFRWEQLLIYGGEVCTNTLCHRNSCFKIRLT